MNNTESSVFIGMPYFSLWAMTSYVTDLLVRASVERIEKA